MGNKVYVSAANLCQNLVLLLLDLLSMYIIPSDTSVTIQRGEVLADFVTLDGCFNILPVDFHEKIVGMNVNLYNNVKKVKGRSNEFVEENSTCDDFNTFISYFDFA